MTFTFRSACVAAQQIRLRLFDETLDLIYLDGMRDYIITATATEITIACQAGDQMCYGGVSATPTPRPVAPTPVAAITFGVGLNNDQQCRDCCFTCAGTTIPEIVLRCASP